MKDDCNCNDRKRRRRPRDPNARFRDDGTDKQFNFTGDSPTEPSANDNKDSGGAGGKEPEFGSKLIVLASLIIAISTLIRGCDAANGHVPSFTQLFLTNGSALLIAMLGFALIKNKK